MLTVITLLTGCGGGPSGPPPIVSLSIWPEDFTAHVDDLIRFMAFGEDTAGQSRLITQGVTWESSDPDVGEIDDAGDFAARASGTTQVAATYQNLPPQTTEVTVVASGAQPTAAYFPLGIGHWWEYTGSEVGPGAIRTQQEDVTLTVSCVQQDVILAETWYRLDVDYTEGRGYLFYQHDEEGLREWRGGEFPIHLLKQPLIAGQVWLDPLDPEHYFAIESVTETVEVPAGTFNNCVRVREHVVTTEQGEYDIVDWYAVNVGRVKSKYLDIDPDTQEEVWVEQELMQYDLAD